MKSTEKGNLGLLAASLEFSKQGYETYFPSGDNVSIDLIVVKDFKPYRVEVKTTNTRTKAGWVVRLQGYSGNMKKIYKKSFVPDNFDFVAVYLQPIDEVKIIPIQDIKHKTKFTLLNNL
jgi:hypothetical protein